MRSPVIADLVDQNRRLEVRCCVHRCRRLAVFDPADAVQLLGAATTFAEARARLVCSACGARGADRLVDVVPSIVDYYTSLERAGHTPMPR